MLITSDQTNWLMNSKSCDLSLRLPAIARTSSIASTGKNSTAASIRQSPFFTGAKRRLTFRTVTHNESRLKEQSKIYERRCFTTIANRCDAGSTHKSDTRNSKHKTAGCRSGRAGVGSIATLARCDAAGMLVYCLIVRGGIFDGWAGFYYAFQRTRGGVDAALIWAADLRG